MRLHNILFLVFLGIAGIPNTSAEKFINLVRESSQQSNASEETKGSSESEKTYKVKFQVEEESAGEGLQWQPQRAYITQGGEYESSFEDRWDFSNTSWSGCVVPEGRYYVILETRKRNVNSEAASPTALYYIVKPDVEVKSDMTITFRQSDAKNMLTSEIFLPNGKKPESKSHYNDYVKDMQYNRYLNNSDGAFYMRTQDWDLTADTIYVNDLDERWTYAVSHAFADENGCYISKIVEPGPFTSSRHFTNNPADYVETVSHFNDTPATNKDFKKHGVNALMTWQGFEFDFFYDMNVIAPYEGDYSGDVKLWIDSPRSDMSRSTGFDVLTVPTIAVSRDGYGDILAKGAMITPESTGASFIHIRGGLDGRYKKDEYPYAKFYLPPISPFNYVSDETSYFTMAPALALTQVRMQNESHNEIDYFSYYPYMAYPKFEEVSLGVASSTITNNGQTLTFDSNSKTTLYDWMRGNYQKGPTVMELDVIYSHEGGVERHTRGIFSFDTTNETYDVDVPSVVRWQLRSADDELVEETSKASTIIFESNTEATGAMSYAEESTGNWVELPSTQNGLYFKAPLSKIDPSLEGKRLDLKFCLATPKGYTSEQTIESAIVYRTGSSVNEITETTYGVRVEGRDIIVPEGASIYTISGVKCGNTNLSPGIYIVTLPARNVKVIVK